MRIEHFSCSTTQIYFHVETCRNASSRIERGRSKSGQERYSTSRGRYTMMRELRFSSTRMPYITPQFTEDLHVQWNRNGESHDFHAAFGDENDSRRSSRSDTTHALRSFYGNGGGGAR